MIGLKLACKIALEFTKISKKMCFFIAFKLKFWFTANFKAIQLSLLPFKDGPID
jgi:hypothetical protein